MSARKKSRDTIQMSVDIGRRIRIARKSRAVTCAWLANEIGTHGAVVAAVERGERGVPRIDTLARIAGALGCTLNALLPDDPSARVVMDGDVVTEEQAVNALHRSACSEDCWDDEADVTHHSDDCEHYAWLLRYRAAVRARADFELRVAEDLVGRMRNVLDESAISTRGMADAWLASRRAPKPEAGRR